MADRVHFSVDGIVADFLAALDDEMRSGMDDAARMVADDAAAQHPYENRTGRLQSRTVPGRTTGSASRGRVVGEVLGDTPYGSFVDEGTSRSRPYPFLEPAYEREKDAVENRLDESLERAAARSFGE